MLATGHDSLFGQVFPVYQAVIVALFLAIFTVGVLGVIAYIR